MTVLTVEQQALLKQPITALEGLSTRTANALERRGIVTVHQLLMTPRATLLGYANIGAQTLEEIFTALAQHGFVRARRKGSKR